MFKIYVFVLAAFLMAHCGNNDPVAPSENPVDKDREIITNITGKLVFNGVKSLEASTKALAAMGEQACSSEGMSVATFKKQWAVAMTSYHYLEVAPYGPIGENQGRSCDGGAMACRIYSWPLSSAKAVRNQMKKAVGNGDKYRFRRKESAIGLDALEYMLYGSLAGESIVDDSHGVCPYLSYVTADLAEAGEDLRGAFESVEVKGLSQKSTDDEFRGELQKIVKSFKFFEKSLLYKKVNLPLGFSDSSGGGQDTQCERGVDCHAYLEHEYSQSAKDALLANIQAFQSIYEGGSGFGIYDYLADIGELDRAEKPRDLIISLVETLQSFPSGDDFTKAVAQFNAKSCGKKSLCTFQKEIKELSDWIKSDLLVLLSKELPSGVQGDND